MMMHRLLLLSLLAVSSVAVGQDRPLPPKDAAKAMTLPEGFRATLFAGEPDVVQPIAMTFDDRGRLWVVECLSYPKWSSNPEGNDRVVMFEDTDGDGQFDKRQVVFDKGANLSSIELGFGGIWLCSIPNLLFIPCDFNADVPKIGKPEAVLDGWSLKCRHNVVNGLIWGPDGWLYGLNGIIDTSKVGKPGTPEKDRTPMNCGVWRYHPTRKVFEVVAHGTTNPFGLDFNEFGEMFMTNCVIGHLWHVVPGGHYERMYGQDLVPNTYQLMKTCADHIHWGGGNWTTSRGGKGIHSEAGGGHAHVGCMVYLGDNWPDEYRGDVYMLNLHGNRINRDSLERQGSGHVAKHKPDFMLANDPWFRGIALKYGPDGGVYVSDWTDTGECHNYDKVDPSNGRIFKITYGKPKLWRGDLSQRSNLELVKMQLHKNEWQARHARRLLQERTELIPLGKVEMDELNRLRNSRLTTAERLRCMWTLYVTGTTNIFADFHQVRGDPEVNAWAWRLLFEGKFGKDRQENFRQVLLEESLAARIHIASCLQKLDDEARLDLALFLLGNKNGPPDLNSQLMFWYGIEPLLSKHPAFASAFLTEDMRNPMVTEFAARRITELAAEQPGRWNLIWEGMLQGSDKHKLLILQGVLAGLDGRRQIQTPAKWPAVFKTIREVPDSPQLRSLANKLAVIFGDVDAVAELTKLVADRAGSTEKRYDALQTLLIPQNPATVPLLNDLLDDRAMRGSAIRALAAFKNDDTPKQLLAIYPKLSDKERADVIQTLAARSAWAMALLDAIEAKQIPRSDVTVFIARQMQGLKDEKLQNRLATVWGQVKPTSKDKVEQIAKFKKMLTPESLKAADLSKGRLVYSKNCASCHRLYDDGGNIGPALTGSQRTNLDYVLENMLDPSAVVAREYQMTKIETVSGRTINGIIKLETDKALTLQTPNEIIVLPKDEIESRSLSPLSIMPEGVLEKLTAEEIRDLVAYLASKDQVPLPKP